MSAKINEHYLKLKSGYLFPEISRRVANFQQNQQSPQEIIKLGIGDVTLPLPTSILKAFHDGVDEMGQESSFRGYGPEQGYLFLRETIAKNDYQLRNINIDADEIFISDGSKCDTGNIIDILALDNKIAVTDPVYPVYVDTNVMSGRSEECDKSGRYKGIVYLECTQKNNFIPNFPNEKIDIIYLCFPNNPTGIVANKDQLSMWVDYAKQERALILFDAAYEAFITDDSIPHSIFEIPGAKEVAIEFRSFSKNAGFTGTRCAFSVIPKELKLPDSKGNLHSIHTLWNRRHSTKFNGVSYPVQKAAAAVYSEYGKKEVKQLVDYYMNNAQIIKDSLYKIGYTVYGGTHSPYVWVNTKEGQDSWSFFDIMLEKYQIVGTPGSGFGPSGEGYFRFSSFANTEKVKEAMRRITS